jgi:hypothetical protein
MSDNYQKIGKLYTLNTTGITTITGASFLHGLYNGSNAAASVVVDNTHIVHVPSDDAVYFPTPLGFSTVRMYAIGTTGVLLYS